MEIKERKKVPKPSWYMAVKVAMLERDNMSVTELADILRYKRQYLSAVLNGRIISPPAEERICSYLGINVS